MVTAIVGANWGDEGKGKITDMLGEESDIIVRFQGGSNAGHTIINVMVNLHCTYYHRVFFMITRQVLLVMVLHLIFPIFSMRSMRL